VCRISAVVEEIIGLPDDLDIEGDHRRRLPTFLGEEGFPVEP